MEHIVKVLSARAGAVFVRTHEEQKFLRLLTAAVGQRRILVWSVTRGWRSRMTPVEEMKQRELAASRGKEEPDPWKVEEAVQDPAAALQWVFDPVNRQKFVASVGVKGGNTVMGPVLVFLDPEPFQDNPMFQRALRDVAFEANKTGTGLCLLGAEFKIPSSLEKEVLTLEMQLPSRPEMAKKLTSLLEKYAQTPHRENMAPFQQPDQFERLLNTCMGMTELEVTRALNVTLATGKGSQVLEEVTAIKCKVISDSGLMDFYPASSLEELGGMDLAKRWLTLRKDAYTPEAAEFGLQPPKGLLLLGVAGCGKSQFAKGTAGLLGMSLIKLDIGRLMGGIVGQTESNIRRALELAERVSPCVLWLDEIEKGLAGSGSSDRSDGGTTARLLATILTWMNDKKAPVFVVATANRIEGLPPELLRKGRFDEIFFVDLPNDLERLEILKIHLRKCKRDPALFDLSSVVEVTQGFSGAEIEQLVKEALFLAFRERHKGGLTVDHLVQAAVATVPLSKTSAEQIDAMRMWCSTRARPASSTLKVERGDNVTDLAFD